MYAAARAYTLGLLAASAQQEKEEPSQEEGSGWVAFKKCEPIYLGPNISADEATYALHHFTQVWKGFDLYL
jgi:hypothetical protein